MTAINVIRQSAAVHILTDGAAYRSDGTLDFTVQKVFSLAHLGAAFAGRGATLFPSTVAIAASAHASSFDDLKMRAVSLAKMAFADLESYMTASSAGPEFDLVFAGWSKTTGPDSFFICNHKNHGPSVPPWQIVGLGPISLLPRNDAIDADLDRIFPNGVHPDQFDPEVDGLRVLEIQRARPVAHFGGGDFGTQHAVGAFAQLTTVTPDMITTKIVRRWPDEIGRPLAAG